MSRFNKPRLVVAIIITGIVIVVSLILFPNWQDSGFWGVIALFVVAFVGVTTWLANFLKVYFDDESARQNIKPIKAGEVDLRNAMEAHLDLLKIASTDSQQVNRIKLFTEVRHTDEAVLINSEIRYSEHQDFPRTKDSDESSLQVEKTDSPSQLDLAYRERIREANSVSLNILVWGPSDSDSDLYRKRVQIRHTLRILGHTARFSEDEDWQVIPELRELTLQQRELIQAQLADLIIVLYSSYGSIAETHDIGNLNDLKMKLKLLILVDQQHMGSYGAQGLLKNLQHYNRVYPYAIEEMKTCSLMTRIIQEVDYCRSEKWDNLQRVGSS